MSINILVPDLGESVLEATVRQWRKQVGERVAAGEPLVELETEKVNLDVSAERAGVLSHIERKEGEDVKVGEVLGVIDEGAAGDVAPAPTTSGERAAPSLAVEPPQPASQAAPQPAAAKTSPEPAAQSEEEHVTPVARRLAEEFGVDLKQIQGTGPGGRVTKQDVHEFAEKQKAQPAPPVPPSPPSGAAQVVEERRLQTDRREERVRMSRRRQTIARRLVEAQQNAAMLTTFNELDMSAVMEIRARHKESFQARYNIGLGFMSFFVKASIGALRAFPHLNAEIQNDEIVLKHYYDIGIAVDAAEGLVVPVLRDADKMSFAEIERRIKEFAQKAQANTLSLDDLRGGTFTITNGGVFGSLLSTPILNPPQVGILGMHKIEERPIARNGQVVIRPMMYVALSYDHRIVDGREAVQFLVRVKELTEDPSSLLLEE